MNRCPYAHTDGRQCVRPSHASTVRHMLTTPFVSTDQATTIAEAWGFPPRDANAAARGATSGGAIPAGKFIRMLEATADAFVNAAKVTP